MNKLLKELQPATERIIPQSKGSYSIVDSESLSKYSREMQKKVDEKSGEILKGFSELDSMINEARQIRDDISGSFESFSRETDDLRESIDQLNDLRESDGEEIAQAIESLREKIEKLSENHEKDMTKRETSIINQVKNSMKDLQSSIVNAKKEAGEGIVKHSNKYDGDIKKIYGKFATLEDIIGKIPKDIFEFGTQLSVSAAGVLVGVTSFINFKSGFTVVANGLGIDITATGGSGAFPQMTTAQRLASSPINGSTAYDTNLNVAMIYVNGTWGTVLLN